MEKRFGELLRASREEAGVSMGTLARHLRVSVPYLSDVERGNRPPLVSQRILEAASFLAVDSEPLFTAAAEDKGCYELNAAQVTPRGREVGASLMRGWPSYTDSEFEKIQRLLDDLDQMERLRRGKS